MLKQRIITAVLMLLVLLPALFAQAVWPFALLTLAMVAAAGWEWGRLNGFPGVPALLTGAVVATGAALMWQAGWIGHTPGVLWVLAMLVWVLGGALVLRRGVTAWPQTPRTVRSPKRTSKKATSTPSMILAMGVSRWVSSLRLSAQS